MLDHSGAGNGIRTRDTKLGKLVLYQLSYARPTNIFNKFQEKSQGILIDKAWVALSYRGSRLAYWSPTSKIKNLFKLIWRPSDSANKS